MKPEPKTPIPWDNVVQPRHLERRAAKKLVTFWLCGLALMCLAAAVSPGMVLLALAVVIVAGTIMVHSD